MEKRMFLELLKTLPSKGEFFTDDAVRKAAPYTRVLLALTERDVKGLDLYPFLALSRGLLEHREQQEYGVKHFREIAHPEIRLSWAVILFDEKNAASPEIVTFLQAALKSREQEKILSEMLGPGFGGFKERLSAAPGEHGRE